MPIKSRFIWLEAFLLITSIGTHIRPVAAQNTAPSAGIPVQMVVSAEAHHGTEVPTINREDVMVYEGRGPDRLRVIDWVPAQGEHAGLDLLILLDDSSAPSLGPQLEGIRAFIHQQSPTTFVGVGYMRNGMVYMAQDFTQDHAAAAKSLRLPQGIGAASPYFSLVDVIKRWPTNPARPRREVLMISDGIDHYYDGGPPDPYVDSAIEDAQRAGIVIFTIYTPAAGHYGHSLWRINWGQIYLSQLSDQTGGETYYLGFEPAVSFAPFLDQLSHRLQHQYLLTFLARPAEKAGLQRIRVTTEVPNVDLIAADRVWVPAASAR